MEFEFGLMLGLELLELGLGLELDPGRPGDEAGGYTFPSPPLGPELFILGLAFAVRGDCCEGLCANGLEFWLGLFWFWWSCVWERGRDGGGLGGGPIPPPIPGFIPPPQEVEPTYTEYRIRYRDRIYSLRSKSIEN